MKALLAVRRPARYALFAFTIAVGVACAGSARAQIWNEVGDAGDLPATAQMTSGTGSLASIKGNLASATDVDMYCIHLSAVPPAGLPIVQLQCVINQGPNVWLFDAAGNGVFTNETCSAGYKTILAPSTSLAAGNYFVAVAYNEIIPQAAAGGMWLPGLLNQRAPDGPGAAGIVTSWAGATTVQPLNPYQLDLVFMNYCDAPTPARHPAWGTLKIRYR